MVRSVSRGKNVKGQKVCFEIMSSRNEKDANSCEASLICLPEEDLNNENANMEANLEEGNLMGSHPWTKL